MDRSYIKEIQEALRALSFQDTRLIPVVVDGIYTRQTAQAVRTFQELYDLNPTGEVDAATWQELRDQIYDATLPVQSIAAFPNSAFILYPNEVNDLASFLQIMLQAISTVFGNIRYVPISGVYDFETVNAIRQIQQQHRLEPSGNLDAATWNVITTLYNHRFDTIKE